MWKRFAASVYALIFTIYLMKKKMKWFAKGEQIFNTLTIAKPNFFQGLTATSVSFFFKSSEKLF